ncbi:hypothetical protein CYMTET_55006 [Cymbomonas tetramitiformis]|uniref:Uncharacterized protein n=1 Tax=Cymbomonas tetramitiformis TaxID=36881 RepID=A0AAE0BE25_9CHLO|nr:hypothetical protein CYMTET_55006 [Cymbomonas tetramitiformis]
MAAVSPQEIRGDLFVDNPYTSTRSPPSTPHCATEDPTPPASEGNTNASVPPDSEARGSPSPSSSLCFTQQIAKASDPTDNGGSAVPEASGPQIDGGLEMNSPSSGTSHVSLTTSGTTYVSPTTSGTTHVSSTTSGATHVNSTTSGTTHLSSATDSTTHVSPSTVATTHVSPSETSSPFTPDATTLPDGIIASIVEDPLDSHPIEPDTDDWYQWLSDADDALPKQPQV